MADFRQFTNAKLEADLFIVVDGILQQHILNMKEIDKHMKNRRNGYILDLEGVMGVIQDELKKRIIKKFLITKVVRPYRQRTNH